jgi:4-diphosphocytidyl-2C-methyl-D-erythritol kinase
VRALSEQRSAGAASALGANDFEAAVSSQYPQLKTIMGKLRKFDALGVRMTGSGSAVFAIFESGEKRERVRMKLQGDRVFQGFRLVAAALVGRSSYRRLWRRQLAEHLEPRDNSWPPHSQ